MPLVEQELVTPQEHIDLVGFELLDFCYRSLFVFLALCCRFTDSDYPFGISKLFLKILTETFISNRALI